MKTILAILLISAPALFAELQITGLKVEMVWDNPYQPSELRYQLETDFSLAPNATIDPLKDDVVLIREYPEGPCIIFSIPAGGFAATDKGFEVLDPKAAGMTIQRVTAPGPNNEPPIVVDDLSGLWSDLQVQLRTTDGVQWQFSINGVFSAEPPVAPITGVPALVHLNIGDDAGAVNPCEINYKSPRDPASGIVKAEHSLSETVFGYNINASWLDTGTKLDPFKDAITIHLLDLGIIGPPDSDDGDEVIGPPDVVGIVAPVDVVAIPAGAFSAMNKGFVVHDPKAAGVTIQSVDPKTGAVLAEHAWVHLNIRLRSSDGVNWQLHIGAEFDPHCDFQGGCSADWLFRAVDQVNLSAGDDKLGLRIGNIEYGN